MQFKVQNLMGTKHDPRNKRRSAVQTLQMRFGGILLTNGRTIVIDEGIYRNNFHQIEHYVKHGMLWVDPIAAATIDAMRAEFANKTFPIYSVGVEQPVAFIPVASEPVAFDESSLPREYVAAFEAPEPQEADAEVVEVTSTDDVVAYQETEEAKPRLKRTSNRKKNTED